MAVATAETGGDGAPQGKLAGSDGTPQTEALGTVVVGTAAGAATAAAADAQSLTLALNL